MNTLDAFEHARGSAEEWRRLHLRLAETIDLSESARAARQGAEATLREALVALGSAVLRRFGDAPDAEQLKAALAGQPLVPPAATEREESAARIEPTPPRPTLNQARILGTGPIHGAAVPPEPRAPAPPPAAPVEVTPELLTSLSAGLMSGRSIIRVPAAAPEPSLEEAVSALQEALALGGEPAPTDATPIAIEAEQRRVCGLAQTHLAAWGELAPRANFALSGWLTARLRHAQVLAERAGLDALDAPLAAAIRRLSAHSKETQPGFIHGLGLGHAPQHGSWLADAAEWRGQIIKLLAEAAPAALPVVPMANPDDRVRVLTERVRAGLDGSALAAELKNLLRDGLSPTDKRLINLARPFADALDGSALAPLRKAIRELIEAESDAEDTSDAGRGQSLPADWPLLSETRGRRVVIVGGDPRPERAVRLKAAFDFGEIEWLEGSTTRKVDALKERMRNGSVDLVIVLRAFNSHKVSDAIFGVKADQCLAILADGYGVTQVRLGLERFLVRAAA